jgi:hypothetical protein
MLEKPLLGGVHQIASEFIHSSFHHLGAFVLSLTLYPDLGMPYRGFVTEV